MRPEPGKPEKRHGNHHLVVKLFGGVLLFLLILLTIYISGIKRDVNRELRDVNRKLATITERNSKIKSTKQQRIRFLERQSFLNYPEKFSLEVALFLNTLSRSTPGGMDLVELKMTPINRNLGFVLQAVMASPDPQEAQSGLSGFYLRLNAIDGIIHLSRPSPSAPTRPGLFIFQGEIEIE
jgi:hypothetical protein